MSSRGADVTLVERVGCFGGNLFIDGYGPSSCARANA